MKRYILLIEEQSKYEDFKRYHYRLFNSYLELQKHLSQFWWIEKNYRIFEETKLTRDYSINTAIKELY